MQVIKKVGILRDILDFIEGDLSASRGGGIKTGLVKLRE